MIKAWVKLAAHRLAGFAGCGFALCLLAFRPFIEVRIGVLPWLRFGHLLLNTEYFLRTRARDGKLGKPSVLIFLSGAKPANRQLLAMIAREGILIESRLLVAVWQDAFRLMPRLSVWIDLRPSGEFDYPVWNHCPPVLGLTEDEQGCGEMGRKALGIEHPYVCITSRDQTFLNSVQPDRSWDYHSYRNTSPQSLGEAAQYLLGQGFQVVRMGRVVSEGLSLDTTGYVDYALSPLANDLLDVHLLSHCDLFVGDASGIFAPAVVAKIPYAMYNMVPFGYAVFLSNAIFIPKKFYLRSEKRFLCYSELIAMGLLRAQRSQEYDEHGIDVVSNTAAEIKDLVQELVLRHRSQWEDTPEADDLQARYRALFHPDDPVRAFPGRVGARFLQQNIHLLD